MKKHLSIIGLFLCTPFFCFGMTSSFANLEAKGWAPWLSMGSVTDNSAEQTNFFQWYYTNALFSYEDGQGVSGNQPVGVVFPLATYENMSNVQEQVFLVNPHVPGVNLTYKSAGFGYGAMPVMVVYTAFMSNGITETDFTTENMFNNFATLAAVADTMESFKTNAGGFYPNALAYPKTVGAIILNPDFLGSVQKDNLTDSINSQISSDDQGPSQYNGVVNWSVAKAVCFATYQIPSFTYNGQKASIQTQPGNYLNVFNQMFKVEYDAWDTKTDWNNIVLPMLTTACNVDNPPNPQEIIPAQFTNDLNGWIQANNWLIRQFGPDLTFGWQENLWAPPPGTVNWLHQNLSSEQLSQNYVQPIVSFLNQLGVYNGPIAADNPDFIVFDKYERNEINPNEQYVDQGFLFNARDWNNYLNFVQGVTNGLGTAGNPVPAMLWQIPGGHLVQQGDTSYLAQAEEGSTAPDYFLGDATNPLANIASYVSAYTLPSGIYNTSDTSILNYLAMSPDGSSVDYTWQQSHLQQAVDSNVFAILWGGGNTTSPSNQFPLYYNSEVTTPTEPDNRWLELKLVNYYNSPYPLP